MIKKSFFSIIVPVYNSQDYLKECLDSILAQSYKRFEVLVINDCSTDRTEEILNTYKKFKKIRIFTNKINLGCASSRNVGLKEAVGSYICFLDSDDIWDKNFLQEHYAQYQNGFEFVFSSYKRFSKSGSIVNVSVPINLSYNKLMFSNFIANSSASYDRSKLGLFLYNNFVKISSDYVYWLDIFKLNPKNIGLNKKLLNYRVHQTSLSSNKFKTFIEVWLIHRNYLKQNIFISFFYIVFWIFFALKKRLNVYS